MIVIENQVINTPLYVPNVPIKIIQCTINGPIYFYSHDFEMHNSIAHEVRFLGREMPKSPSGLVYLSGNRIGGRVTVPQSAKQIIITGNVIGHGTISVV